MKVKKDHRRLLQAGGFMAPVSPVFHTVVTVSWSQRYLTLAYFYTLAGSPASGLVLNPLVAYTSTTVYI